MPETFPWDDVGRAQELEMIDSANVLKTNYGGGYKATRARTTKIPKTFTITWTVMSRAQWLAFVEFWRSVHGSGDAFYCEFPLSLYGVDGYGGFQDSEPPGGWDDEGPGILYGLGPVFLVRFLDDNLQQRYLRSFDRWEVTAAFEEVA